MTFDDSASWMISDIHLMSMLDQNLNMNPGLMVSDIETSAMEEKHRRENYTQLVGACLVSFSHMILQFDVSLLSELRCCNFRSKRMCV